MAKHDADAPTTYAALAERYGTADPAIDYARTRRVIEWFKEGRATIDDVRAAFGLPPKTDKVAFREFI